MNSSLGFCKYVGNKLNVGLYGINSIAGIGI